MSMHQVAPCSMAHGFPSRAVESNLDNSVFYTTCALWSRDTRRREPWSPMCMQIVRLLCQLPSNSIWAVFLMNASVGLLALCATSTALAMQDQLFVLAESVASQQSFAQVVDACAMCAKCRDARCEHESCPEWFAARCSASWTEDLQCFHYQRALDAKFEICFGTQDCIRDSGARDNGGFLVFTDWRLCALE